MIRCSRAFFFFFFFFFFSWMDFFFEFSRCVNFSLIRTLKCIQYIYSPNIYLTDSIPYILVFIWMWFSYIVAHSFSNGRIIIIVYSFRTLHLRRVIARAHAGTHLNLFRCAVHSTPGMQNYIRTWLQQHTYSTSRSWLGVRFIAHTHIFSWKGIK